MDGNTPIDVFDPQFTQREACEVARVDAKAVNNWIDRGHFRLTETKDRRLSGRRLFSIQDVGYLAVMGICTRELGMAPADAMNWASAVAREFWHVSSKESEMDTVHLGFRSPPGNWSVTFAYADRETGRFYQPGAAKIPLDLHLHPFLVIPSSRICRQVFLECAELLLNEEGKSGATDGLDPSL